MDASYDDLVTRAARGDGEAVELLLDHHLPELRVFVRLRMGKLLRAKESSSDLVQSACLEVLRNADRFRHARESAFKHWLYATALRKILDHKKRFSAAKRDAAREAAAVPASSVASLGPCYATLRTPSQEAISAEEIARIEGAFDHLHERDREVVTLSRIVGLSHREMAHHLGKSEAAVRTMLSRALARLSVLLDEG